MVKRFDVALAKTRFIRPILHKFRETVNRCETERLDAEHTRRAILATYETIQAEMFPSGFSCDPKPFAGKYPTRVCIFKAPRYVLITAYYFGKRTFNFSFSRVQMQMGFRGFWAEFDRENLVMFRSLGDSRWIRNSTLIGYYYPTIILCGVNTSSFTRVVGVYDAENRRPFYLGSHYAQGDLERLAANRRSDTQRTRTFEENSLNEYPVQS
jgi:hypothetical protein